MPLEIMVEVLFTLAYTAVPDVRRWDGTNLGWLSLYWTCTDLRTIMNNTVPFWSIVCTQLPRAHLQIRALARGLPLAMRLSGDLPAMPTSFGRGTSSDRRRLTSLIRLTDAHNYAIVNCTDLRFCVAVLLKWLATTGSDSPLGLPHLTRLELQAPVTFDVRDREDKDAV